MDKYALWMALRFNATWMKDPSHRTRPKTTAIKLTLEEIEYLQELVYKDRQKSRT